VCGRECVLQEGGREGMKEEGGRGGGVSMHILTDQRPREHAGVSHLSLHTHTHIHHP
jgi:hypothetical protein